MLIFFVELKLLKVPKLLLMNGHLQGCHMKNPPVTDGVLNRSRRSLPEEPKSQHDVVVGLSDAYLQEFKGEATDKV